jgi:hypothetical protein
MRFIFALLLLGGAAQACPVPVFRYALERWEADPYGLWIYHNTPLTADQQSLVETLQKMARENRANVDIRSIDKIHPLAGDIHAYLKGHPQEPTVSVVLVPPAGADERGDEVRAMLSPTLGPLDVSVKGLLDSPARREIARRILSGDSAVFLFIESGDKAKDDAAFQTLSAELEKFQKHAAALPTVDDTPELATFNLSTAIPLRLAFTTLRIARNDPAEQGFLKIVGGLYPKLPAGEPVLLPVFGRGRSLGAAAGDEIRPAVIAKACEFITGACTCEIKDQNPGHDLLMAVDWTAALHGKNAPLPPLVGIPAMPAHSITEVVISHPPVMRNAIIAGIVLVVVCVVASAFVLFRKKSGPSR